jgi:integrase
VEQGEQEKKPRRPKGHHGSGHIVERPPESGKYYGRLMVGYHPDGRRWYITAKGPSWEECNTNLQVAKRQWELGTYVEPQRWTFREYVENYWLEQHGGRRGRPLDPATKRRYSDSMRLHILPILGRYKLTEIRPRHIQMLQATLHKNPNLSWETKRLIAAIARMPFSDAVRWQDLPIDPTKPIPRLAPQRTSPQALDDDELLAFLTAAESYEEGSWVPYFVFVALAGTRRGEALGLEWSSIDWDAGTAQVTVSKTDWGMRELPLPPEALDALRRQRLQQNTWKLAAGPEWKQTPLVFTTPLGEEIPGHRAWAAFKAIAAAAGLPRKWTVKHLRSTFMTALAEEGVHPAVLQALAGHSSPNVATQYYVRVRDETKRRAMTDRAARVFRTLG